MEEYLKIKINLKIQGPINFSKTFAVDYKDITPLLGMDFFSTFYNFVSTLNTATENLGRALNNFECQGFDINYKQDK